MVLIYEAKVNRNSPHSIVGKTLLPITRMTKPIALDHKVFSIHCYYDRAIYIGT